MKVLYTDIETSPLVAHLWGLFNQNVSLSQLLESTRMICFAARWRGAKRTEFYSEFHDGKDEMILAAHQLLTEADVVVHFNGKRFDVPHFNREFLQAGLRPPAPYQQVDLLEVVKKNFRFPSNKLAHVTQALGLETKATHDGHETWIKCLAGDPKAWAVMKKYCIKDTEILEPLHDKILPWVENHPNMRLFEDVNGCPNCGVDALVKEGFSYTSTGKYQRYSCGNCGRWCRDTKRLDGTTIRAAIS